MATPEPEDHGDALAGRQAVRVGHQQDGSEQHGAAQEERRHDRGAGDAAAEHGLGGNRVDGVGQAGAESQAQADTIQLAVASRGEQQRAADEARPVAGYQRVTGRSPLATRATSPVKTGPLPMATSVPRATPARSTAAKKHAWYPATATIPATTGPIGRHHPVFGNLSLVAHRCSRFQNG